MKCIYLKIRSKKYEKYIYCQLRKERIKFESCKDCMSKEYKTVKRIKTRKHAQTKATSISKKVKELVWHRDKGKCIICGKYVPVECSCCHFIPRSLGGLGIPENIYTGCTDCHREQDNGLNAKEYDKKVEDYLKNIYGPNWNREKLIYKKY